MLVAGALAGCGSTPEAAPPPEAAGPTAAVKSTEAYAAGDAAAGKEAIRPGFSGARADRHERALAALRPRLPGSGTDEAARRYLTGAFVEVGARVWELRDGASRHLLAEIEGTSPDRLMLVAPYSVVAPDAWIGDAGPALLLELARQIAERPVLYTVRFALAETRASEGGAGPVAPIETPTQARERVVRAGASLARSLARSETRSEGVLRGLVAFDAPGRPGLRFARDIRSHPIFRDVFWKTASRLGASALFPSDGGWASPRSLHLGLEAAADGKVLALVDEAWTRPERRPTPTVAASPDVLERSGRVTLAALDALMARLARIDGFGAPRQTTGGAEAGGPQGSPGFVENPPSS